MNKGILLITPPFTQLNTPYPATAYLKGFLNTKGIPAHQLDLGIDVINAIFCKGGLEEIFSEAPPIACSDNAALIYQNRRRYINTVDAAIAFLQGQGTTMARLLATDHYLPRASRFLDFEDTDDWAFGMMGFQDKAKHMATLYLEDLGDYTSEVIDADFGFSRYAERLGRSANSYDEIYDALQRPLTFVDNKMLPLLEQKIVSVKPALVCFTVPFPGNLYSALRCGQYIKEHHPNIQVAMGGGFANTELRSVCDPRVFESLDFITLDDGELPIELLYQYVIEPDTNKVGGLPMLKRTFLLSDGAVTYNNQSLRKDYSQLDVGTPDYAGLDLASYISVIEVTNPMHSLWSDGRWNKLTMAHGCYWGKCTFCDVSLDYIGKYEPLTAEILVNRMEELINQTGQRGFHFVDEAAPPSLMKALALEILRRGLAVTWWTNIRFEKKFTSDLCKLLAASGCIAVSGGLEVASDRLLDIIKKGVSVSQVAKVTDHLTRANIMVHAYLMYGYPTQTIQETVDSLEMTRQLFEAGVIQSGFWHQFALTSHSPIGKDPDAYGIISQRTEISFADNDVAFADSTGIDHTIFSDGLKVSLHNYMQGVGFDIPLQEWFEMDIPKTTVPNDYIQHCLHDVETQYSQHHNIIYLGQEPLIIELGGELCEVVIAGRKKEIIFESELDMAEWLTEWLDRCSVISAYKYTIDQFRQDYEVYFEDFEGFFDSDMMLELREDDLIVI